MKNVLLMVKDMNIGGVEKSLLSFMNKLIENNCKVTLILLEKKGGFLEYIPDDVNIIELEGYKNIKRYVNEPPLKLIKESIYKRKLIIGINLLISYLIGKVLRNPIFYYRYIFKDLPKVEGVYDVAIAYQGPMDIITEYIRNNVRSLEKEQWIHFDIKKININKKYMSRAFNDFTKIKVVSNEGMDRFLETFPQLKSKVVVEKNIINKELILGEALKEKVFDENITGIKLVTVGRISKEKGQDLIIEVAKKLKKEGYRFTWYLIGDGAMKNHIEKLIKDNNLIENVFLEGAKINPYPYMKNCDIYIQPSRYEGYCISLNEVKVFSKPIVATNFTGASEQLENYENGKIVNFNKDEVYKELIEMIKIGGYNE